MASEIYNDDQLFGSGEYCHDQEVPSNSIELETSPPVTYRRERFRYSKNQEIDTLYDNTDNEVFDDSKTYISKFDYGQNSYSSMGNRRSKSLPDLVLSSPEQKEKPEGMCNDVIDKGPDVTSFYSKTFVDHDALGKMKDFPPKNPKVMRRSVSFQENPTKRSISPVDKTAAEKRHSYRKSSGYGTGDSKTDSMQSSINSNASSLLREDSKDGPPWMQQNGEKIVDMHSYHNHIEKYNPGNSQKDLPILSIFEKSLVSSDLQTKHVEDPNYQHAQFNLPAFDKIFDNDRQVPYIPEYPQPSISQKTVNDETKFPSNVQIIHKLPLGWQKTFHDFDKGQDTVHVPEEQSPSLKIVLQKYCRNNSSVASIPPEKSPILHNEPSGEHHSCTCGYVTSGKDQLNTLTDLLRHTDDEVLQRIVLEHFLSRIEGVNIEDISKASMLSDSSLSTPSPSEYRNNLALTGSKKSADDGNEDKVNEDEDITAENVELMSRCRDHNCTNKLCNKVRMRITGLETALENGWSSDIPLIKTICRCLWTHANNCDDSDFKCSVSWCHHLSQHIGEMDYTNSAVKNGSDDSLELNDIRSIDDRSADDVFAILTRIYRTPALTCSVIPAEPPQRFYKLASTNDFGDKPNLEIITSFGHFRSVFLSVQSNNPVRQCVLKRINKFLDDETTSVVYQRMRNVKHKNVIQHFWLAEYSKMQVYHICMEFLKGGTLEECLQITTITPQRGIIYMLQIIDAVLYLHKLNIIYLYWSCSNMLFMDTSRSHIKLSNLSLSVLEGKDFDVGKTKLSLPPCIVPPELTENEDVVLRSLTDSWGAGCLFAEMLTGKQPWYDYRHRKKEELWKKMKSGEELPLNEKQLKNITVCHKLLKSCWKREPVDRISLEDMKHCLQSQYLGGYT